MKQSSQSSKRIFFFFSAFYGLLVWALVVFAALICFEVWNGIRGAQFDGESFVIRDGRYVSVNPQMPALSFPVYKDEDVFRVFILGSSQAMGWPYVQNQSRMLPQMLGLENRGGIATWLEDCLQALMPERKVEVYNAAMDMGSPMRRAVDVYGQIAALADPDLCIILEGNNEDWEIAYLDSEFEGHDLSARSMGIISGKFEEYVTRIMDLSRERYVLTFLLTVPNNIRDYRPEDPDDFPLDAVRARIDRGDARGALGELENMPGAGESPRALYCMARCYDRLKDFGRAREYYLKAKDKSGLCQMHRCRSRWNDIIRSFDGKGEYLKIFDFEKRLFASSRDTIPGYDMFLSGCHMNIRGNRTAAREIAGFFCDVKGLDAAARARLAALRFSDLAPDKLIINYRLQKAKLWRQRFVLALFRSKYGLSRLIYGNNITDNIANYDRLIRELKDKRG